MNFGTGPRNLHNSAHQPPHGGFKWNWASCSYLLKFFTKLLNRRGNLIFILSLFSPNMKTLQFASPINEFCRDPKCCGHILECEGTVGFQELSVGKDTHLPHIVPVVWCQQPIMLQLSFHPGCAKRKIKSNCV